jgi:hypothetical protein
MTSIDTDREVKYRLILETPRERRELKATTEAELAEWSCARTAETIKRLIMANGAGMCDTERKQRYRLRIETPFGSYEITADSGARLMLMASPQATNAIAALIGAKSQHAISRAVSGLMEASYRAGQADGDIQAIVRAALVVYNESVQRQGRRGCESKIVEAGMELDILTCYLQRMTAKQIVEWFKCERQFQTSKSAVARLTGKFWRIGIRPVRRQRQAASVGGGE